MSDADNSPGETGAIDDLAAEYVLGTLASDELAEATRRIADDPAFAMEVASWQNRLAPLLEAIPEVRPPEGVFYDIRQRIGSTQRAAPEPSALSMMVEVVEHRMRSWRRMAIMTGTVAAGLAAFVFFREVYQPRLPGAGTYVAVLESDGREPAFVASIDIGSGSVAIRRVGSKPEAGKSHELWAIGGGRTAPQSLGVVDVSATIPAARFGITQPSLLSETVFAISLEPEGGSKTGKPTGPVVFTGKLVAVPKVESRPLLETINNFWLQK